MENGEDMETDDIEEQYVPEGGIRIGRVLVILTQRYCRQKYW